MYLELWALKVPRDHKESQGEMESLVQQEDLEPQGHPDPQDLQARLWRLVEVTAQQYKDQLDPKAPEVFPAPRAQSVYLD